MQVENEYGSFGDDHEYMSEIHQALIDAGFNKTLFYTADGAEQVAERQSSRGFPIGINFGGGNARKDFAACISRLIPRARTSTANSGQDGSIIGEASTPRPT